MISSLASFTNYAPLQQHLRFVGLANFAAVLRDGQALTAYRNIAVFCAISVLLDLGIGFALAYLLRHDFRGRALLRVGLLIPWLVGDGANGVMWHFLLGANVGMMNYGLSLFGLPAQPSPLGTHDLALLTIIFTEVWHTSPLVAFLLLPGITSIPSDHWEQASLDGASLIDRLRYVALPVLRPLLFTLAMLFVGETLGTFDGAWVMTDGGPSTAIVTPGLLSF